MNEIQFERLGRELDKRVAPERTPITVPPETAMTLMRDSMQRNAPALSMLADR